MEAEVSIGARAGVSANLTGDQAHPAGSVTALLQRIIETPQPVTDESAARGTDRVIVTCVD